MPLEKADFGAIDVHILTGARRCLLFLDLQLHHVGWVLYDLRDIRDVARPHLAQDALADPDNTAHDPVPLYFHISQWG